jgi:hypothetical protein
MKTKNCCEAEGTNKKSKKKSPVPCKTF